MSIKRSRSLSCDRKCSRMVCWKVIISCLGTVVSINSCSGGSEEGDGGSSVCFVCEEGVDCKCVDVNGDILEGGSGSSLIKSFGVSRREVGSGSSFIKSFGISRREGG